jgi:hypothetical protein
MREADSTGGWVPALTQCRLLETSEGGALFRIDIENCIELGELEEVVNFFGQVQQFKFAAAALGGGVSAHKFADAGAIDVIHVPEIEHDMDALFIKQATNSLAQQSAALPQRDFSAEVHNGGLTGISMRCA